MGRALCEDLSSAAWAQEHQKLSGRARARGLEQMLLFRGSTALPVPGSQTCSLLNCETINFCCLSHSVCGTLLQLQKLVDHYHSGTNYSILVPSLCLLIL